MADSPAESPTEAHEGDVPLEGADEAAAECAEGDAAEPTVELEGVGAALLEAATNADADTVAALLAQHDIPDDHITQPLDVAVKAYDTAVVATILNHRPSIVQHCSHDENCFMTAAEYDAVELLELMLPHADVNLRTTETALNRAVENGASQAVQFLLSIDGIDVNARSAYGATPLGQAVSRGFAGIVRLLLECPGISVEQPLADDTNILVHAVLHGYYDVVEELLRSPLIAVNSVCRVHERTALSAACQLTHPAIALMMLASPRIEVNVRDISVNRVPLMYAAGAGHVQVVEMLLKNPTIDINALDQDNNSALGMACIAGHAACVRALLACPGIAVNTPTVASSSPFEMAVESSHADCVQLLLSHGSTNVNYRNAHQATPLICAAEMGATNIVAMLCKSPDVDVNAANVVRHGSIVTLGMLLNPRVQHLATALHLAAYEGHFECVKLLLQHPRIDVNATNETGQTPLMSSMYLNHIDCAKEILAHPLVNVNHDGVEGSTPLMKAVELNCIDIVAELLRHPKVAIHIAKGDPPVTALSIAETSANSAMLHLLSHYAFARGSTAVAVDTAGGRGRSTVRSGGPRSPVVDDAHDDADADELEEEALESPMFW